MTPDEQRIIRPAARLGYLIFAAAVVSNPFLWPLGAVIALNAVQNTRRES
jgi:hypothetical protein